MSAKRGVIQFLPMLMLAVLAISTFAIVAMMGRNEDIRGRAASGPYASTTNTPTPTIKNTPTPTIKNTPTPTIKNTPTPTPACDTVHPINTAGTCPSTGKIIYVYLNPDCKTKRTDPCEGLPTPTPTPPTTCAGIKVSTAGTCPDGKTIRYVRLNADCKTTTTDTCPGVPTPTPTTKLTTTPTTSYSCGPAGGYCTPAAGECGVDTQRGDLTCSGGWVCCVPTKITLTPTPTLKLTLTPTPTLKPCGNGLNCSYDPIAGWANHCANLGNPVYCCAPNHLIVNNACVNGSCVSGATKQCTTSVNCPGNYVCVNGTWDSTCYDIADNCPPQVFPTAGLPVGSCTPGTIVHCTTSLNCPGQYVCPNSGTWDSTCYDIADNCPPRVFPTAGSPASPTPKLALTPTPTPPNGCPYMAWPVANDGAINYVLQGPDTPKGYTHYNDPEAVDIGAYFQPIVAVNSGTVSIGNDSCYGKFIHVNSVCNGSTFYAYYGHLSAISVSNGQTVTPGQTLGVSGDTGSCAGGAHLHFQFTDTGSVPTVEINYLKRNIPVGCTTVAACNPAL